MAASEVRIAAVLLPVLIGCGSHRAIHVIPEEAAACVPSDTIALAGLRLDQIRTSLLYPALPAAWRTLMEPLRDARDLLIAYNGHDLLLIAEGRFTSAPAGAVLLGPTLAVAGSPAGIRAAAAQHATGRMGAARLLQQAETVAGKPIWAAIEGHASLPVAGNFINLNRILQYVDYATFSAAGPVLSPPSEADARRQTERPTQKIHVRVTGVCAGAEQARQLEESLRALLTLTAAAIRDPELRRPFQSAQVMRHDSTVQVDLTAPPAAMEKLLP